MWWGGRSRVRRMCVSCLAQDTCAFARARTWRLERASCGDGDREGRKGGDAALVVR